MKTTMKTAAKSTIKPDTKRVLLFVSALLAFAFAVISTGCSSNSATQSKTTIKASEEALSYAEGLYQRSNVVLDSAAQLEKFNNKFLPVLKARTSQSFPDVETNNVLGKQSVHGEDVYTLSKASLTDASSSADCIVLYIHGGAWAWDIDSLHVAYCDKLVDALNADVYMPLYPLAPQATYAEAYAMLNDVYDMLSALGKPIIIMGDSAGGNIALGLTLSLKDAGKDLPKKVILFSPASDITFTNSEIEKYEAKDGTLELVTCKKCAELWAGDTDLTDPILSPVYGDFKGFPDTLLVTGTAEIIYPDNEVLYKNMCNAGVNITFIVGEDLWHVFPIYNIPENEEILSKIIDFCQ